MLTDTHAHLNSEEYNNIEEVINQAKSKGIKRIINCAVDIKSSVETIKLSEVYEGFLFCAIGIHPSYANEYKDSDINDLESLIKSNKITAIGEIGLDYYYKNDNKNIQLKLFEDQLNLAQKYNLPVIIHSREATNDTIEVLKKYKLRGIIHCFTGSIETAKIYIKLGFLLGIGGVLTFKNSKLSEVVSKLSLENIALETDSPYLTPEPYRKYKNEPAYLIETANYLASLKGIEIKQLEETIEKTICKIFDF